MGSEHQGFSDAANTVVDAVQKYIEKTDVTPNIKIWITGYSRAAATTNIAAHKLNDLAKKGDIEGLKQNNLFAYCFECPQTVIIEPNGKSEEPVDENIFNIVNHVDIVTKVAPSFWFYTRYGTTYYVPSEEQTSQYSNARSKLWDSYTEILSRTNDEYPWLSAASYTATMLDGQGKFLNTVIDEVASYFIKRDYFVLQYQDTARNLGIKFGGGNGEKLKAQSIIEGLLDIAGFTTKHPKIVTKLVANFDLFWQAHYAELCYAWMRALDGKCDYVDPVTRQLKVNCPVNIDVYDSNDVLVAKIEDDTVIELEDSTIVAYIDDDDQKVIILPVDDKYTVLLVATDNSTVTYTATEYNIDTSNTERVVSYYEVDIVSGDELMGVVENLNVVNSAEYPLYMNDSKDSLEATIDQSGDDVTEHTVAVTTVGNGVVFGGGSYVSGEFAKVIAEPDSGETFLGWYINSELASSELEYRFLVDNDVDIVARFTTNTNKGGSGSNGGSSGGSSSSGGSTGGTGSGNTTPSTPNVPDIPDTTDTPWVNPFADVSENDWFYDDVAYVVQNGLMTGIGNGQFNPSGTTTRGMIMTILARLAGVDTSGGNPWYQPGMEWAMGAGVSDGTGPEANITREQFVTMLWRYAGEPAATGSLSAYPDAGNVSGWASNAMIWAVQNGIINGSNGKLNPLGNALRSEAAAMLTRYCNKIKK